jgi:small ligand-binding sensory domain FIST
MEPKIVAQKDYYVTEVTVALPTDVAQLNDLLQALKTNGKMVVQYNHGPILGVNIEQRLKVPETVSSEIRRILGIDAKVL